MARSLHAQRPCDECPFRRDVTPGMFPSSRFERLRELGTHDAVAVAGAFPLKPMFACHKSASGKEIACAGWLATVGHQSLTVRLNVALRHIPASALTPGPDWPELYKTYDQMMTAQGGDHDDE